MDIQRLFVVKLDCWLVCLSFLLELVKHKDRIELLAKQSGRLTISRTFNDLGKCSLVDGLVFAEIKDGWHSNHLFAKQAVVIATFLTHYFIASFPILLAKFLLQFGLAGIG